jgi:hypothetical protein
MDVGMLHLFENPIGRTEREIVHEQLTLIYYWFRRCSGGC